MNSRVVTTRLLLANGGGIGVHRFKISGDILPKLLCKLRPVGCQVYDFVSNEPQHRLFEYHAGSIIKHQNVPGGIFNDPSNPRL